MFIFLDPEFTESMHICFFDWQWLAPLKLIIYIVYSHFQLSFYQHTRVKESIARVANAKASMIKVRQEEAGNG
jgi:hypothetical protein